MGLREKKLRDHITKNNVMFGDPFGMSPTSNTWEQGVSEMS